MIILYSIILLTLLVAGFVFYIKQQIKIRALEEQLGMAPSTFNFVLQLITRWLQLGLYAFLVLLVTFVGIAFINPYFLYVLLVPEVLFLGLFLLILACFAFELGYLRKRLRKLEDLKQARLMAEDALKNPMDFY